MLSYKNSKKISKVGVLALFKFLFSFVYTQLKIQSGNNIITDIGAEKIAHTKIIVFFCALAVGMIYTALTNHIQQTRILHGIFLFFIFTFIILAIASLYREALLVNTSSLEEKWKNYPALLPWISILKNWLKVLFFAVTEIFGQLCIVVLFWSIANDIFSSSEAKKLYPIFIAAGTLGSILSSMLLPEICRFVERRFVGSEVNSLESIAIIQSQSGKILAKISSIVLWIGALIMILALFAYKWLVKQPDIKKQLTNNKVNSRESLSFIKSCKYILSSKHLILLSLLIVSCATATTLFGVTYFKYVEKLTYKVPHEYADWVMVDFLFLNLFTILSCLFTGYLMKKIGWRKIAYIVPIAVIIFGTTFFSTSIYNYYIGFTHSTYWGKKPVEIIASLGRIQFVLLTTLRYGLFDSTKEIAIISFGKDERRKAKGAIDVVGSNLGKGMASWIHAFLLVLMGATSVFEITPVLLIVLLGFCFIWLYSIRSLDKFIGKK